MSGERFSEGRFEVTPHREKDPREKDPLLETKKRLEEIDRLMGQLVEQGGDMSAAAKTALRNQIAARLAALGISMAQLADLHVAVIQGIQERRSNPHTPGNFPDLDTFQDNYAQIVQVSPTIHLPRVYSDVTASDVADYRQSDWRSVQGRGTEIVEYSYRLGQAMSDEVAYTTIINRHDEIKIGRSWKVDNGRHRSLALKILGSPYTRSSRMDSWVDVKKVTE